MLSISRTFVLPETELVERFLRADGPGGQHVNRTESAVELRFDVTASLRCPTRCARACSRGATVA